MFHYPVRRGRLVNPFAMPDLGRSLSVLLMSAEVQKISFAFGSVIVLPEGFRAVAEGLAAGDISVKLEPTRLEKEKSDAEYDADANAFSFRSNWVLTRPEGRGTAVHEASHAVADWRGRSTSIRSEEGAAYLAEALYHLNAGSEDHAEVPDVVLEVAHAVRAQPGHVSLSASQINGIRRAMMEEGYENGFYANDGF